MGSVVVISDPQDFTIVSVGEQGPEGPPGQDGVGGGGGSSGEPVTVYNAGDPQFLFTTEGDVVMANAA